MAFLSKRRNEEEIEQDATLIWACQKEGCKGWMRQDFSFHALPSCPLCGEGMEEDIRMLPLLSYGTPKNSFL